MVSPRKLAANRKNSLKSSGPRTVAGKRKSSANALTTGLYARLAVLPALGETAEDRKAFCKAVIRDLDADGPAQRCLADRIAGLFWRLRRVPAAEGAALQRLAARSLPSDPDSVSSEGVDWTRPLPPNAPPAARLALLRALLRVGRADRDRERTMAGLLANPLVPDDEPVDDLAARQVLWRAGEELGLKMFVTPDPWDEVLRGLGVDPRACEWTVGLIRRALGAAASAAGRDPAEFHSQSAARVAEHVVHLGEVIARREAEERELVERMHVDRALAVAAAVVADENLVTVVSKQESHLGRELLRSLDALERLKAARSGGGPNPPHGGFVPPGDGFDEPGLDGRPILPFIVE